MIGQLYPAVLFGPKDGQLREIGGLRVIQSDDGIHYPVDLVARSAHLFEGKPVYDKHRQFGQGPMNRPMKVGRVLYSVWDSRRCEMRGFLDIVNPHWQRYLEALASDELPGLSPVFYNIRRGPPGAQLVERIREVQSMDISQEPLSGARVLSTAEGIDVMNLLMGGAPPILKKVALEQLAQNWIGLTRLEWFTKLTDSQKLALARAVANPIVV